ncbi:MAG: ATP-binding cassette domain-containing protein [Chitinivibrionales bacterium]|nr:ATP-binding cassette domain-containing protein [Chitinivibrionales bacterium]
MNTPILHMKKISKRFGAVKALKNVDLTVDKGSVHALIGENGAGKSTLMKILSGALRPDYGTVALDGCAYAPESPKKARAMGIAMIYQELTLAPHLTIAENITLGMEHHHYGVLKKQDLKISQTLTRLGHSGLDLNAKVSTLGIGEQQIVEIARALITDARVIIMDEPTSSLSASDTETLFATIRRLKQTGVTVIYISHFLEEIKRIADHYTVLRDGQSVDRGPIETTDLPQIINAMIGRPLTEMFPRVPHTIGEVLVTINDLSRTPDLAETSFCIHKGEILGIAGLVGAKRTDMLRTLFGLDRADNGTISFANGVTLALIDISPRTSLKNGVDLLSENRKEEGLALNLPIRNNITLSSLAQFIIPNTPGFIDTQKENDIVETQCKSLSLRYTSPCQKSGDLSGGNQQKVALARLLVDQSDILLLDEPTRGIDVGSKTEIYRLIGELALLGKSIVMVSSYLPELFGMCDSLAVMYRGTLSPVWPCNEWNEKRVMAWATSGKELDS